MGRVQRSAADFANPVTGAADTLQGGCDGRGRLDEHDFIEVADVDAELQRVGGDDRLEFAFLEARLDLRADFPCQRAMVGVGQRRDRVVVELEGDLLGHAPRVGEEQRRVIAFDDVLETVRQRFPDLLAVVRGRARGLREADPEVDRLLRRRLDDADGAPRTATAESTDVFGHVVERPDGGGQGDSLEFAGDLDQPLEAGHQLDAATVLDDRVDLVEDHRLHRRKRLAPAHRGEQQVQALRRRDQQLRRPAQHTLAVVGFGVAAAGLHAELGKAPLGVCKPGADLRNRSDQVRPDVVVQRLER